MRRRIASCMGLLVGAALLASCGQDSRRDPTSPLAPNGRRANTVAGTCTSFSNLVSLVNTVFGAGSPNANSALGKLNNLNSQLQHGDTAGAQAQAQNLVSFIQTKAQQGGLPGTNAQIQALISGVLCFSGLTSGDTFLIFPSDQAQILKHSNGQAGISLQANTVTVPTLITINFLPNTTSPLQTKLDQYPGFVEITSSSNLTKTATVAVCPDASVPPSVLGRLRLGHQAISGFEITPQADGSFIQCSTSVSESGVSGVLHKLASFFMPTPLYAKTLFGSGVAGLATEFSPFGPVDDELFFSSGAGGTRTEFQKLPGSRDSLRLRLSPSDASSTAASDAASKSLKPGNRSNTVVNGVCTQIDALIGQPVEQQCRPAVTVKTFQGTIMAGVPINWAIGQGGGVVAPETRTDNSCGTFGSSVVSLTDATATASVCWTLGNTPGTNTVVATGAPGGDAPLGVVFDSFITFTATANQITPTVGATGGSFPYDGLGHPGIGTCSNNLTPALSYTGGVTPTNVGTYTLTVTCGAGNPLYVTVTATATIQITPATTNTSVSCPASAAYTGSALTPCSATVTGPGLNQAVSVTYGNNVNVGTATASAAYAGGGNYAGSNGSTTFQITPAATTASVSCPASVTYTGSPITPCTGSVTGPGLSQSLTPTYVNNIVGMATATVTYPGGGNYQSSTASKTFQIKYVQSGCFASPIYSVMPPTKSFQKKGSNVPIKCTLLTSSGAGVTDATGNLVVQDLGTDGTASPLTVFSLANAFKSSGSGNYAYGLDTNPSGFVSGHFYLVSANWSDGSTTTGFFYVK